MWSTRIFLIGLLLVKVNARPGGYGVKGGRVSKATATAVASAHADAGSFGTAKSSASAVASASSNGGGSSDAIAHANASTDGGNIVRGDEPREKENRHANELGDSDDLRESNDRGKGTEYKSINHQDGTGGWNSRNPDAEHVASGADDADSIKTEETQDEPDCSPKGIKGHRGTSSGSAGSGCKNRKPGENSKFPAQHGNIDLSVDWQHSTGENGGENLKPGTIDRGHAASPCTPGDPECLLPVPAIFNPRPSYNAHPVLPDDSLKPPGIQASYGQHVEKPETFGGSPCACTNGNSKCQTPNHPHPSYENHPHVPLSTLTPPEIANSYSPPGGIDASHSVSPCAPGDSKCFEQTPSDMSPYPKPQRHPDSSIGSHKPTESISGYGENSEKPGKVDRSYAGSPCGVDGSKCSMGTPAASNTQDSDSLCGPGDSNCIKGKPVPSKPHSTFGEKSDSTDVSSHPMDIDDGYGEHKARPGHSNKHGTPIASPCGSDSKCDSHRPTTSGHHSGNSQHSIGIGSQYGGNSESSGTITPAHSGHPAPGKHPGTSNPFLNGEIDVSSLKSSSNSGAASDGIINPLNPFLNPHHPPHNPTGPSNQPSNSNGNTGSPIAPNQQNPQAGSSADNDNLRVKPNPSNPFLYPHGHVNPTSGANHPGTITGSQTVPPNKFPSVQAQPGINGSPNGGCHGSASCVPHKPSELFPIAPDHPGSGHHETKPNSPNPFFSHNLGHKDKPEVSTYPETNGQDKPHAETGVNLPPKPINDCQGIASCAVTPPPTIPPKNPFFTNHGHKVETDETAAAVHKPTQYPNAHGSSTPKPDPQPSGLNPFLGHGKDHSSDEKSQTSGSESGIYSNECDHNNGQTHKDSGSSVTEGFESDKRQNNYGVKGRRPGVKGGSRGPPMKLQGSSRPGESGETGSGQSAIAQSSAVASANAFSHASASSSAAGAQSSASAKSEAYSTNHSPDGLSGSWASSRAEASAFASSYSSSSSSAHGQGGAIVPEIPAQ